MEIISCNKLTKNYGNVQSLKDISFKIEGTGCVGFLGPNGSGKTTTIRILTGLAKKTSGDIKVLGYDIDKDIVKIKENIGYCPQIPNFYNYMTVMEWMYWVGDMYNIPKKEVDKRADELLELCGILEYKKRRIGGFSGGMKQRLAIAQALINNPKILILDEPVSALDPMGRHDVLKIIEKLKSKMTIFMSTHILDDIEKVADKVIIINKGNTLLCDDMDNIKTKYIKPLITFTLSSSDIDISNILKKQTWVTNVEKEGQCYNISSNNLDIASSELIKIFNDNKVKLESYGLGKSSLEDIFLKVVND